MRTFKTGTFIFEIRILRNYLLIFYNFKNNYNALEIRNLNVNKLKGFVSLNNHIGYVFIESNSKYKTPNITDSFTFWKKYAHI